MPYINIKVTNEPETTPAHKAELIKGATDLVVRVLGKNPNSVFVVIDEVEHCDWGAGGVPVDVHRSQQSNEEITTASTNDAVNTSGATGIALQGYDPVSFFTAGEPTLGDPSIQARYEGGIYLFATEKNQELFKSNPAKYAPQYGGYCAFGVSLNALFPVDVGTAQVRDGKLFLNFSPKVSKIFNDDIEENLVKAEKHWPHLIGKDSRDRK